MKTIKSIKKESAYVDLELLQKEVSDDNRCSNFLIWFNGTVIDSAKTMK